MLKLKRFDVGVWHDWPGDTDVKIKIRPVGPKQFFDLKERCKKHKIAVQKPNGDGYEIVDEYDDAQYQYQLFSEMVEDIKGIEVEGVSDVEKIKETLFNHRNLRDWIVDRSKDLFDVENKKLEGELKNFESSQGG